MEGNGGDKSGDEEIEVSLSKEVDGMFMCNEEINDGEDVGISFSKVVEDMLSCNGDMNGESVICWAAVDNGKRDGDNGGFWNKLKGGVAPKGGRGSMILLGLWLE